jgi:hypothetical protein
MSKLTTLVLLFVSLAITMIALNIQGGIMKMILAIIAFIIMIISISGCHIIPLPLLPRPIIYPHAHVKTIIICDRPTVCHEYIIPVERR